MRLLLLLLLLGLCCLWARLVSTGEHRAGMGSRCCRRVQPWLEPSFLSRVNGCTPVCSEDRAWDTNALVSPQDSPNPCVDLDQGSSLCGHQTDTDGQTAAMEGPTSYWIRACSPGPTSTPHPQLPAEYGGLSAPHPSKPILQ